MTRVLHIASWYPNPSSDVEGNFIRDQIKVFLKDVPGDVVVVKVINGPNFLPSIEKLSLDNGAQGYFFTGRIRTGKITEAISTLLLLYALFLERAWKYDLFHFHIAYPLLMHSRIVKLLFQKKVIISEHWTAYHRSFDLPRSSRAARAIGRIFQKQIPVFAVSKALVRDIENFSGATDFRSFVIPNVVPLHGASPTKNKRPVFFAVNVWRAIKNPIPMLEGLARLAADGREFTLVIGGYGEMMSKMKNFVDQSDLKNCTQFLGKMSKSQIAHQLSQSDGYIFSSNYETFSVASAEALGAGVPLIGPYLSCIAEYATEEDWLCVKSRNPDDWQLGFREFLDKWDDGVWDSQAISQRLYSKFSEPSLRRCYRSAMNDLGFEVSK